MNGIDKLASELQKAITDGNKGKKQGYDTTAEVVRVDGDTVWVRIPGGYDETPVTRTNNANLGDEVLVRVAGGRAWLLGNKTDPSVGGVELNIVGEVADKAVESAGKAQIAAEDAHAFAGQAYRYALEAEQDAISANNSANSALTQLGVVEDVVGVLNWISTHATTYKASTDTQVVAGKMYFTKSGDVYTPVASPTGNPSENGYYEIDTIDEAVSNYVSSHLALTNAGLWVINDNNSYKVLLASDGMKVYDASGNLVSTFGESISFSSTRTQYIGGEDAYIVFNASNGEMSIGGQKLNLSGNVTISGTTKSLTQVLQDMQSEIDGSIETWYYAVDPTTSNLPASSWTTQAQKENHLRDLYFNTTNGHSFRWAYENNEFKWVQIADEDAAAALRAAQAAQQTADNAIKYVEYAVGTSSTSAPSTGWSTSSPVWEEGKYVWMRQSKDGVAYTYTCIQGAKGATGGTGPEAVVTIYPDAIDWDAGTATLAVVLRVDGEVVPPNSFSWTQGPTGEVVGTDHTLNVTDLSTVYNCTVTWDDEEAMASQTGSIDFTSLYSNKDYTEAKLETKVNAVATDGGVSLISNINAIADRINLIAQQIRFSDTNQSSVFEILSTYMNQIVIDTSVPSITIGDKGLFAVVITNDEMQFFQNNVKVAYLNSAALHVENRIAFADFQFLKRANGHFTLKFIDQV